MKRLLILAFALYSASAFAGVVRFSAKHVVEPSVKASFKAVQFSAKKTYHSAKKAAKVSKAIAY